VRTKQKKYKFSKGEINPKLLERQDLPVLESSASYIKNLLSTPYGSIRTRGGTQNIAKVATNITAIATPTITNNMGGTGANLYNLTALFESTGIENLTELFRYDFGGSTTIYKVYTENVYFAFEQATLVPVVTNGVITSVQVSNGGKGLNNVTLTVTDVLGTGATLTPVLNNEGTITSVTVGAGGSNYSNQTRITVNYDEPTDSIKLQGSLNGSSWTDLATYTITKTAQDLVTTVSADYRYLRWLSTGAPATELNMYYCRAYSSTPEADTIKLADFVFNQDQKYVLVLKDEEIEIYEDDVLLDTVTATGLLDTYFSTLKFTQAEDTMVFTHPDMETKQLVRSFASEPYTNDPAAGSNIVLTMADTSIFTVGNVVTVSSSAGRELATINLIVPNTSIRVDSLSLDHTTTDPLVTSSTIIDWTWSAFPFINIPKDPFGNESTSNPAQTLTPSATEGSIKLTTGGAVWTADSVGQLVDGGGGRVRITEYESTTVVYGYTIIPFYTTDPIASGTWDYITGYENVWSSTRGWPTTCLFYEQRLWFGGSKSKPNTIWASRVAQYNDFDNVGNYNNDAINATISSEQIDQIVNIYANRGIQVFTAGAEWIVPEGATTPNLFSVTKNTSNGSLDTVFPVDIAGTTLFIEKNGKSLLGFVYTESQNAYITSSLSLLTDLVQSPVGITVDYNSSQDVGNFMYMVMADGTMAVWCVVLDQKIASPVRFESAKGGLVKDVINVAGDTYILVDRKDVIYLEKISEDKVDMATTDSSLSANITGLSDYTGDFVRVYNSADGDFGLFYVINGEITLGSTPTAAVTIGFEFDYSLISNKIAISGQTDNIEKRIAKATVVTKDTPQLTFENQEISQTDDRYDFYGVTAFSRDCRFNITGLSYDYIEILSILLNINYGEK